MSVNTADVACFIDSNIWLYALTAHPDTRKANRANELTSVRSNIIISTQIINEVSVNLIKKAETTEQELRGLIISFYKKHLVVEIDQSIIIKASLLRERYRFSYWDSLIVASALAANARILYSEDMHNGLVIEEQLTIVNPFR